MKQLVYAHYANLEQQVNIPSLRMPQAEQTNLHLLISEVSMKVDDLKSQNNVLRSEVETTSELISVENQPILRPG